jgi:hypothetical protein
MARVINSKIWVRLIIPIFILTGLLHTALASGNDISELRESLFSFEDSKITVQDLAFYLVTHNYDAVLGDGYVELQLDGEIYRLVPNGNAPGVCDISPLNAKKLAVLNWAGRS